MNAQLVKGANESGSAAKANKRILEGAVVSRNDVTNTLVVNVGAYDANGDPVYLAGVPFQPQTPPKVGDTVSISYGNVSPHSFRVGSSGIGGSNNTGASTSGVNSIHADSDPHLQGDVRFVSGSNIGLSQSGHDITVTYTGPIGGGGIGGGAITFSGSRVYNSGTQTINDSTETALTFDSERYDTDAYHSTSSNTSRLVAPVSGYYRIGANVEWDAGVGGIPPGFLRLSVRLNGTTVIGSSEVEIVNRFIRRETATEYFLSGGDYVEIMAFHTTTGGGTLTILSSGNYSPEATISLIGV